MSEKQEKYKTNRHSALLALRESRDWETALTSFLDGKLELSDLTNKEKEIYDKFLWMWARIKDMKGKFMRDELVEDFCHKYGQSESTANRIIAFINKRRQLLNDAESELGKYQLYSVLWDELEEARGTGQGELVEKLSGRIDRLMGYSKEKTSEIDPKKLEQHINILIADDNTLKVLEAMRKQNIDDYNPSYEDIMKMQNAEYEDITD